MDVTPPHWPAPQATGPVQAVVPVPGSKSETNRMLVLAAIADATSSMHRPLLARDTELMVGGLRALGADVTVTPGRIDIAPGPVTAPATIDVGLAGTVMRFLPPVAALADGPVAFDGDPRARERPMAPLLDALVTLGVRIDDDGRRALPFTVAGSGHVGGGPVSLDAGGSSQFVSALLLTACRFDRGLDLTAVGAVPSPPHVAMTVALLRAVGVVVDEVSAQRWRVHPGQPTGGDWQVAPDLSNAAPFLAAALVTGGSVTIPGWATAVTQPGDRILEVLSELGGLVESQADGAVTVRGSGRLCGITANLADAPELVPTVVALASLAESPTTISGVAHLRGHETDRLAALSAELNGLGGDVTETADGLVVRPTSLHGGVFHTYADHRLATTGAVLGLAVPGVLVEDIATTGKTLPGFDRMWQAMLTGQPQ